LNAPALFNRHVRVRRSDAPDAMPPSLQETGRTSPENSSRVLGRDEGGTMNARMTCQQILDTTQRLIETGGLVRFATKETAHETNGADATICKQFKRKEDLCLTLVLENSPKFKDAILQKRPGRHSVTKNLETIALAAIRFSEKLIPLGVTLCADAQLLERHRQAIREGRKGPKEVLDLLVGYIDAEQRLGRINERVDPLSAAALLFGPCFHWARVRHGLGRNVLSVRDRDFVAHLVATLMQGLSPPQSAPDRARTALSRFMIRNSRSLA
jgi:AcrR family transcriptional regulator